MSWASRYLNKPPWRVVNSSTVMTTKFHEYILYMKLCQVEVQKNYFGHDYQTRGKFTINVIQSHANVVVYAVYSVIIFQKKIFCIMYFQLIYGIVCSLIDGLFYLFCVFLLHARSFLELELGKLILSKPI